MILSLAQLQALKADIAAHPDLAALPNTADGNTAIAALYNALAGPAFFVWATAVPVQTLYNAITWAQFTPSDAPDNTVTYSNRALLCQGKQFNLQIILQGQATINGARAKVRNGLTDALTNLPSGTNGNLKDAGSVAVLAALTRPATRGEQLFADTSNGNGAANTTPATLVIEGGFSEADIETARSQG